jgi:hypothetical protein
MDGVKSIFGTINPPVGGVGSSDPGGDLGRLIGNGINLILIFIGMIALVYMLWGAVSWVTSSGEKERLQKAQGRIRSAVVGIFISILVLVIFNTIFLLAFPRSGIITPTDGGFRFTIPTFKGNSPQIDPCLGRPSGGPC